MSEVTAAVPAVVPEVKDAPQHVVEKVDEHTPAPPVTTDTEHGADGLEELKTVVTGLATSVATLTDLVTGQIKDESPHSVPWTHRGSHAKEDD